MHFVKTNKNIAFYLTIFVVACFASSCQEGWEFEDTPSKPAPEGHQDDPHVLMTDMRPKAPGDSTQAYAILAELEPAIRKYQDIEVAKAEGYFEFPGASLLKEVHYINVLRSGAEGDGINPSEPGALLYEQQEDGSMKLVGAMFTAPVEFTEEQLNERVPLSFARWHAHINICTPEPITDIAQWLKLDENLQPTFGPVGSITTQEACNAVGGEFHDTYFGWMVHVYPYKDDVWGMNHGEHGGM